MILELAVAGMMSCYLKKDIIVRDELLCFYQCMDTTKEFARTLKQYSCPTTLHVDRQALPFSKRDRKGNRWTKEQIEKYIK